MASPAQSVLPAFLEVKDAEKTPKVTEQQKELIGLRQEMEMMRQELRRQPTPNSKLSPSTSLIEDTSIRGFGPVEATEMIKNLIMGGLPSEDIVDVVSKRGAPRSYVRSELSQLQMPTKQTAPKTVKKKAAKKKATKKKASKKRATSK
jgi:hypothetical protein